MCRYRSIIHGSGSYTTLVICSPICICSAKIAYIVAIRVQSVCVHDIYEADMKIRLCFQDKYTGRIRINSQQRQSPPLAMSLQSISCTNPPMYADTASSCDIFMLYWFTLIVIAFSRQCHVHWYSGDLYSKK